MALKNTRMAQAQSAMPMPSVPAALPPPPPPKKKPKKMPVAPPLGGDAGMPTPPMGAMDQVVKI